MERNKSYFNVSHSHRSAAGKSGMPGSIRTYMKQLLIEKLMDQKSMQDRDQEQIVQEITEFVDRQDKVFQITHKDVKQLQNKIAQKYSPIQKKPDIVISEDIRSSPNIEHNNFILEEEPQEKGASTLIPEDTKSIQP